MKYLKENDFWVLLEALKNTVALQAYNILIIFLAIDKILEILNINKEDFRKEIKEKTKEYFQTTNLSELEELVKGFFN